MIPHYHLTSERQSRSISFENPTGEPGMGGRSASALGIGRKGAPARTLAPGEEIQLADIQGCGIIRHIWMTTRPSPEAMRGLVIRAYWEGRPEAAIEAPVGDFFGFAHGKVQAFQSAVHSVGAQGGLNIWIDMPFKQQARFTLVNELNHPLPLFYQIDYTLGARLPQTLGCLHVLFRRENPTQLSQDFELLPKRTGAGCMIGVIIGVRPLQDDWWGEGEVKMYLDGDEAFPTIAGTGAEDYVGLSWGLQPNGFLYHGANWIEQPQRLNTGRISMYRWHLKDPVYWQREARVTIQQIGHRAGSAPPRTIQEYQAQLYERQDDWCCTTFWYQAPGQALPPLPTTSERLENLPRSQTG